MLRIIKYSVLILLVTVMSCSGELLRFSTGPDLNLGIADNAYDGSKSSMTTAYIDVPFSAPVQDVNVIVALNHSYIGDLVIKLESPSGKVVTLMSRPGLSEGVDNGSGFSSLYGDLIKTFPVTFDDEAASGVSAEAMGANLGSFGVVGRDDGIHNFIPDAGAAIAGKLDSFDKEDMSGFWKLRIGDADSHYQEIAGSIEQVTLIFTSNAAPAPTYSAAAGGGAAFENRQPTLVSAYMIAVQGIFPYDEPGAPTGDQPPYRSEPFLGEIKPLTSNVVPRGWALCSGQLLPINQNFALFSLLGVRYGGNGSTNFALPDLRGRTLMGAGQGPGLPDYPPGTKVGIDNPVLTVGQLPVHTHTVGAGRSGPAGGGGALDNRQPAMAVHFLIAANGEILIAPWLNQPAGWTRCDGRILQRTADNALLSGHLGNTYGGTTTSFTLPDVRGRLIVGDDGPAGAWPRGLVVGANEVVPGLADIGAHVHSIPGGGVSDPSGGSGASLNNYQPSLVLHWVISFAGEYPVEGASVSFPMLGEMRLMAGASAGGLSDSDWRPVDGSEYPVAASPMLFQLLDKTYGGDGSSKFQVPDLRSRTLVSDPGGLGFGATAGAPTIPLPVSMLPAHTHRLAPEIVVEDSFGHNVVDGAGSIDLGAVPFFPSPPLVKLFTIKNTGVGDLLLGPLVKDGPNPNDFTVAAPGSFIIAPGSSTTVAVTPFEYTPLGNFSCAIHFDTNDPDELVFHSSLLCRRVNYYQEVWRLENFGAIENTGAGADANDYDGDGIPNFLEFATGGNPKQAGPIPLALQKYGNVLELIYPRANGFYRDGLTLRAQFSADLSAGSWTSTGVSETQYGSNPGQIRATYTLPAGQTRGFLRLNASSPR